MEGRTEQPTGQRDELVERLFGASLGAIDALTVYLGEHPGLYRALSDGGQVTSYDPSHDYVYDRGDPMSKGNYGGCALRVHRVLPSTHRAVTSAL